MLERFVEDWILTLDRDGKVSLGFFLCYHLQHCSTSTQTKAAEYVGIMLGKSDCTIHQWRYDFIESGEVPESKQGKYVPMLWCAVVV